MPNKRALYTGRGTASCYTGNNSEPIRGELKHKGAIRIKGTVRDLIIAETPMKQ